MSMYVQILDAALNERSQHAGARTTEEAISDLLACSDQLMTSHSLRSRAGWSSLALASQVAYDIALIELARSLGLACGPDSFDQPERRRQELLQEVIGRGINPDELDRRVGGAPSGAGAVDPL